MTQFKTIRELISTVGLRTLGLRYARFCWAGWKAGIIKKFDDPSHPFKGAPIAGTKVTLVNGNVKVLSEKDRVRINEVTDETLRSLGVYDAVVKCRTEGRLKEDLFHPEFVPDFERLVALDHSFLLNNLVPSVNLFTWIADQYVTTETSLSGFCAAAKELLAGNDPKSVKDLNIAIRHGWLARVVVQQQYNGNRDFVPSYDLTTDIAALDTYVVVPVLGEFVKDVEGNVFSNTSSSLFFE